MTVVTLYCVFAGLVSDTVCLRSDSCWLEILYWARSVGEPVTEKRIERGALPSPACPKRKSHATDGTRLHRPWAASLLTLYHVFNTLPFCSPSRTHTVQLPRHFPLQSLRAYAAILQHWPWFFI